MRAERDAVLAVAGVVHGAQAARQAPVDAHGLRLEARPRVGVDLPDRVDAALVEPGERARLERRPLHRAAVGLVHEVVRDDGVGVGEPRGDGAPRARVVVHELGVLARGVPEVVEGADHAGLEVVQLPHVVVVDRETVQVGGPGRCPVAGVPRRRDGAAPEVLVHVEHHVVPALGVPVHALGDVVEVRLVVGARLRLHLAPGDQEPHEVRARVGVLAIQVRLGELRQPVRRGLGARRRVEAVRDEGAAVVVAQERRGRLGGAQAGGDPAAHDHGDETHGQDGACCDHGDVLSDVPTRRAA